MPNIKSAKKKVLVIERRKQENKYIKSTISTMVKNFRLAVKDDVVAAEKMLKDISSYIDSACSKGVIHKNNASRKISRLYSLLNKEKQGKNVKVEAKKEEPAKEEPKVEAKQEVKAEEKPAKKSTKATVKPTAKKPAKKAE